MRSLATRRLLVLATDDRCETHAITDPVDESRKAIHFQEWWVRYRAQVPTHSFAFVGAKVQRCNRKRSPPPGRRRSSCWRRLILVVSAILAVP